ncbi:hypothetical protein H257_15089 [Aphanomyces astaci]|uniref:WRKY19-like zinc finger domain-containing protein n=1 Tax=Aphanomyces astaci TaxID=112090 RepID=W4FQB0_APHAT|nr:hypothetical protein H257_15089 [Aphanomyces astaci]ETV69126.1 hypothetical protein H257_15089 [Aphanomyces astaci]|eukprot:XP_009841379.1 hypothetical protein H257_15089 [Aphanomyces astaci]
MVATLTTTWSTFSCDEVAFLLDALVGRPFTSDSFVHITSNILRLDAIPVAGPTEITPSPTAKLLVATSPPLFHCLQPCCGDAIRWPRGYCSAHGGKAKCSEQDCTRDRQTGGKCIKHGGGLRCKVQNCPRSVQTRGLCKAHGGGVRCQVIGCCNGSQGGGFCRGHGGGKKCVVPGCDKGVQKCNLCTAHGSSKALSYGVH